MPEETEMIGNLDELVAYAERTANALPELSEEIRILRPGCPPDLIATLRETLPGLPESYLSVLEAIAIDGIAIGYFQLTPSSSQATNLADKLRGFNDPTLTPMAEHYRRHGVYQVASWEADPICVAHSDGTVKIGQVVKYNAADPTTAPVVLADGFEQFLIIAANLDDIRSKYGGEPARALDAFKTYLSPMVAGRQDDMESTWTDIATVVLG